MSHGGHGGHDMPGHDMPMPASCSMNMLWNTQVVDTCVVFRQWHIRGAASLIFTLIIIVALGIGYEWLRLCQRNLDIRIAAKLTKGGHGSGRESPLPDAEETLLLGKGLKSYTVPIRFRIERAALYGLTVFLSFFLMLVFMTYNAYLIAAVVIGASAGHFIFGEHLDADAILYGGSASKGIACH